MDCFVFIHGSDLSSVSCVDDKKFILKVAGTDPFATQCLRREVETLQYLNERGLDFGYIKHEPDFSSLTLRRHGTHDLSDANVDLDRRQMFSILSEAGMQLQALHGQGIVHRDLKPGNIMLERSHHLYRFSGIIDFGLSLKAQRLQTDDGAIGGTKVFAHRSQYNKQARAHPGQDWYSFAMIVLSLTRGRALSVEAELKQRGGEITLFSETERAAIGDPQIHAMVDSLETLVAEAGAIRSAGEPDFSAIVVAGTNFVEHARALEMVLREPSNWNTSDWMTSNCITHSMKIKSHDVLLIIDETGSLASHMPNIKQVLSESMEQFKNAMDLRVDIWAVRDYARAGDSNHETVRKVGYRLVGDSVFRAVELLRADATQHDHAEAYEQAMEEAYLRSEKDLSEWKPRRNAHRTVLLIGDSYAHGWLRKPWLPYMLADVKRLKEGTLDPERSDPLVVAKHSELKNKFTADHPDALSRNQEDRQERDRLISRHSHLDDEFGAKIQEVPGSKGKTKKRANLQKAIERLRDNQECVIHTIGLNRHVVSEYYMIFVAMLGGGVFINGNDSIGHKLIGVLASADPALLQKFRDGWVNSGNQSASDDTEVLNTRSGMGF